MAVPAIASLFASPAATQTITLVENVSEATTFWQFSVDSQAQGFTTGRNELGYDLAGVEIMLKTRRHKPGDILPEDWDGRPPC